MPTITSLPPEIMRMVTDNLNYQDHFSFRIASKTLWQGMDGLRTPNKWGWLHFNQMFEKKAPPYRYFANLICNRCCRLLPVSSFGDGVSRKLKPKSRACITCRIYADDHNPIQVDGVPVWGCKGCYQVFPGISYAPPSGMKGRLCAACQEKLFGTFKETKEPEVKGFKAAKMMKSRRSAK